ncbi:MAG: AAA family ATPase [Bacilli bacterium]
MIKVLTGVRRCGKSSIMKLIINELTEKGVNNNNIFYFNLDKRPYRSIKTAESIR